MTKPWTIIAVMGYDSCYGAEKANLQVLSLLRERGAAVHCLVRSDGTGDKFIRLAAERGFSVHPAGFGPNIFGLHCNLIRYLTNLFGMARTSLSLRSLGKQVDATHIYVPNYIQFLYCWPALLVLRQPIVFRIGDPPERAFLHGLLWSYIIAPRVSQFVANSEFTRQRLLAACRSFTPSRVINNCVTTKAETHIACVGIDRWTFSPMVTYLGQMAASKGVHLAVDAAIQICATHDKICFQFVGLIEPASAFVTELRQKIQRVGYAARIAFVPYVTNVHDVLRSSILHLCPSTQHESSANVVIDAKQAGVPSVVFPRGGLPELISHKVDGYVCHSADVPALVEGILHFLDDFELWTHACEAALASSAQYSSTRIGPDWQKVFEDGNAECGLGITHHRPLAGSA